MPKKEVDFSRWCDKCNSWHDLGDCLPLSSCKICNTRHHPGDCPYRFCNICSKFHSGSCDSGSFTKPPPCKPKKTKVDIVQSPEKTSLDIPLSFKLDKTELDDYHLFLYGTIINTGSTIFDSVGLIITILDQDGNFISRGDLPVEPDSIKPGEIGYVGLGGYCLQCKGCNKKEILTVEYKILGNKRVKKYKLYNNSVD